MNCDSSKFLNCSHYIWNHNTSEKWTVKLWLVNMWSGVTCNLWSAKCKIKMWVSGEKSVVQFKNHDGIGNNLVCLSNSPWVHPSFRRAWSLPNWRGWRRTSRRRGWRAVWRRSPRSARDSPSLSVSSRIWCVEGHISKLGLLKAVIALWHLEAVSTQGDHLTRFLPSPTRGRRRRRAPPSPSWSGMLAGPAATLLTWVSMCIHPVWIKWDRLSETISKFWSK